MTRLRPSAFQFITIMAFVFQTARAQCGPSPSESDTGSKPVVAIVTTAGYSWSVMPGIDSATGGSGLDGFQVSRISASRLETGANTVALAPCPLGVNGNDLYHYLYISGRGTPESVLITGGTCKSGATSGTIQFTAQYPHPVGYSIGSASDGLQEAFIDAAVGLKSNRQQSRNVIISPGTHVVNARVSIRASGLNVQGSGASITCNVKDTCLMIGDPTNANGFSRITVTGLRVRPGAIGGTWPAIEDNAQGTALTDLGPGSGPVPGASFGSLVQIDNDQATLIDRMDTNLAPWSRCDATFCSAAIFGPGPLNPNAGVLWVKNSNLSLGCMANGIDNWDDNTLHVSDSVVQAFAQFGVRASGVYTNSLAAQMDDVYEEVGDCTNPLGTGQAGLIVMGGFAQTSGGAPAGKLPSYSNSGTIEYNYYIVIHSSADGVSSPYLAGYAMTDGTRPVTVLWNKIGRHGIITYDVLRTVGPGAQIPLYGAGNFAIATGVSAASCSSTVCSFTDNVAAAARYAIAPNTYAPSLRLWPGNIVLTSIGDSARGVGTRYFSDLAVASGIVSAGGASQPSVFALQCDAGGWWSPVWIQCAGGSSEQQVGTIYQLGTRSGLKGRLIFEAPPGGDTPNTHVITISDSNSAKTLATPMNRPTADPTDTYIGVDQPGRVPASQTQLAFGSPISISQYIGNTGDGTSWLERLSAANKTFKVPVVSPKYQTASNCISALGSCGSAPAGIIAIAVKSSSITVFTTAVTSKSEIHVDENTTYGPLLGAVCDTSFARHYRISQQVDGREFTITTDNPPRAHPACLSFTITN